MDRRATFSASLALAALSATTGCTLQLVCGPGTIEQAGQCVASGVAAGGTCGAGSVYNAQTGVCEADLGCSDGGPCGKCGPNTVLEVDDAGVRTCVGSGSSCGAVLCPQPAANKFNVCGSVHDLQTTAALDPAAYEKVTVYFFDALAFANSTPDTRPAPLYSTTLDECGHFQATPGLTPPATEFIAVAVDDKDAIESPGTAADDFVPTGVAVSATANGRAIINAFATRRATDELWTMTAGLAGKSFAERGAYIPIFLDSKGTKTPPFAGEPVAGVTITAIGSPSPDDDYYFTDTDPLVRNMLAPAGGPAVTGGNGSGVLINAPTAMYSGTGPAGCTWPTTLAGAAEGVFFVQERLGSCN